MANQQILQEKENQVQVIKEKFEQASISVVTEYRGLSVKELTALRRQLKEESAELTIYKNTLVRIALDQLGVTYDKALFEGPSAFVTAAGDVSKVSKVLVKFAKENEKLVLKAAVMENKMLTQSAVNELAALPSKEELIAKVVGGIKSPLTGLVVALSSPLRGLVYTLQAIKTKKENA